jgi:hypothetical protein
MAPAKPPPPEDSAPDLGSYSREELLRLYAKVMRELRERGFVRTGNSPIGDVGEQLVAEFYGVSPIAANTAGYDCITPTGEKIQVKALWKTSPRRRNLSPIRSEDYDQVAAVIFDPDMQPQDLWLVPRSVVEAHARWSAHVNGRILTLKREVQDAPGVRHLLWDGETFRPAADG